MQWYEAEVRDLIERVRVGNHHGSCPPVFYGSSSIRLWHSLESDVGPGILNLGFGGSTLEACDYFFDRIVPPVHPRSILVYAGDNDLGDGHTVAEVLTSYRSLAARIEAKEGPIAFGFISVKPSPARYPIIDRIEKLNALIRGEIDNSPSRYYVDVFSSMLDSSGKPNAALFETDGLHMNRNGYQLWTTLLRPYHNRIFTM